MFTEEDERAIAAQELSRLKTVIETLPASSNPAETIRKIDDYCWKKHESWTRLNGNGTFDDDLLHCSELVLNCYDVIEASSPEIVKVKLISTLSCLIGCISSNAQSQSLSSRCLSVFRRTLQEIPKWNPEALQADIQDDAIIDITELPAKNDHETNLDTLDALECRYAILEIFSTDVRSRLKFDLEEVFDEFKTAVLAILNRAVANGKTKIVAKICSVIFGKVLCQFFSDGNIADVAKEMLRILQTEPKTKEETTLETRCVGVHCLISSMKDVISAPERSSKSVAPAVKDDKSLERTGRLGEEFLAVMEHDDGLIEVMNRYLISDKVFVRKCGRSILSMVLDCLKDKCLSLDAFTDFIKLLEALELKQLHVVKPAFGLLDSLVSYCQETSNKSDLSSMTRFNVSWLRLAFFNALNHVNAYVVKWAVGKYFDIDSKTVTAIAGDVNCEFLFDVVLPVLDRSDAYYRFSEENNLERFLGSLERFLRGVIQTWGPGVFWRKWLLVMKDYHRAPVALFYLSHVLSVISNDLETAGVFVESDLDVFRSIFFEFRQIPLPFIRAAVQEANLKIFFNLYAWDEATILKACSNVLSAIPPPLVRPEVAMRFMDSGADFSWTTTTSFMTKVSSFAASIIQRSETDDDSPWTVDGLRILTAVLNALVESKSLSADSFLQPVVQNLKSIVYKYSVENRLDAIDGKEMNSDLLVITTWMERRPDLILRLMGHEFIRTVETIVDIICWRVCNDENISITEIEQFVYFLNTVLGHAAGSNRHVEIRVGMLQALQEAWTNYKAGDLRKYFISKVYAVLLEHSPESARRDSSILRFLGHLLLDDSDILRNVGKRFQPLEWNRILSEYASLKWHSLFVVLNDIPIDNSLTSLLDWKLLAEAALDALDVVSGAEEIHCVMRCTGHILRQISSDERILTSKIVKKMHLICYEQRKCDQFVPTVRNCCLAVIQSGLIFGGHREVLEDLKIVIQSFLSESENPSLACCVSEAVSRSVDEWNPSTTNGLLSDGERFLLETTVELCCYGNLLRKDQRMVYDASEMVKGFGARNYICVELIESDNLASQKARMFAFRSVLLILEKSDKQWARFVDYLVDLAHRKLLELTCGATKTGYYANSQCHRIRTRAVQLLLLVEPYVQDAVVAVRLQQFTLRYLVEQNQQPSVRLLLEWLMTRVNLRFANGGLLETWWEAEAYMIERRVGTLCTWMEVLMHTGLCLPQDQRRQHILECVKRWLPWCTAQNFTLRCCAQTCLRRLWTEEENSEELSSGDSMWRMLRDFLTPTVMFDKEQRNNTKNVEKASRDFYFSIFNATRDYTLQTIFHTFPRLCFLPVDELIPVEMWRVFAPDGKLLHHVPIENPSDELATGNVFVWRDRTEEALAEEISHANPYESLQTKTNLFAGDNDMLTEVFLDDLRRSEPTVKRDGLIVVATLVDRPTNLGGLCRTCEIFGATEYVISTYRVAEDFQFQVLSVSSERWVKMIEVKRSELMEYLKKKQSDGYTVVAVEQTTTSRQLTSYQFPAKTLLLLGNEKEGIPVDFLRCVDVCVEIPQIGHTRSLNVHVAGALLIWEYTKQRRFTK